MTKSEYRYIHPTEDFFCSIDCVEERIRSYTGTSRASGKYYWRSSAEAISRMATAECWDSKRKMFFRSKYEIMVADWLEKVGLEADYEKIVLKSGSTVYVPDFYIPKYDCFIEAKGLWQMGAKQKIKRIRAEMPDLRLIIASYLLKPSIKERLRCDA